jgi:hypothetical protein
MNMLPATPLLRLFIYYFISLKAFIPMGYVVRTKEKQKELVRDPRSLTTTKEILPQQCAVRETRGYKTSMESKTHK